ncbi:MAG TPA: MFS transporter, partial [Actinomycetota bacterium]|nr:MFS transporter [Actinomycetota bacterium]
ASRLPEPARVVSLGAPGSAADYFSVLRAGVREAVVHPAVRAAVIAAALIGGLDGLEEYFPLMAKDWGVPVGVIPLAVLGLPLAGAAGAAMGGRAGSLSPGALATTLFGGLILLGTMALIALPAGLLGVAVFYCLHQMILVVVGARLQERIEGPARATVTSVASLGTELVAIALFAAWAFEGLMLVTGIWCVVAIALPVWLKERVA